MTGHRKEAAEAHSRRRARQRSAARLAAVQALYQMDAAGADLVSTLADFDVHRLETDGAAENVASPDMDFFRALVRGVVAAQRRVDSVIHAALIEGWPLKRLDITLRGILRAATYELMERPDVPARVVISEYVDVARAFYQDGDEPGMVNAVLDRVARQEGAKGLAGEGSR